MSILSFAEIFEILIEVVASLCFKTIKKHQHHHDDPSLNANVDNSLNGNYKDTNQIAAE